MWWTKIVDKTGIDFSVKNTKNSFVLVGNPVTFQSTDFFRTNCLIFGRLFQHKVGIKILYNPWHSCRYKYTYKVKVF